MARTRNLIIMAIVSLILGYIFIISPMLDSLEVSQREEQDVKFDLVLQQKKFVNLEAIKLKMQEIDQKYSDLSQLLPITLDTLSEVENIKRASHHYNVEVSDISFSDKIKDEFEYKIPFKLQATGSYADLYSFVYDTFYLPGKTVRFTDFSLQQKGGGLLLELDGRYHTALEYEE